MVDFSFLQTDRLFLRVLEMADQEALFKYRSLPEVYAYQSWRPKDIHEVGLFIEKNAAVCMNTIGAWLQLAVCLKVGHMIGDIGIHFIDDEQVEIGYTLSPDSQGNGYALEAVKAVLHYLFCTLKKHRVTAYVDPNNQRSIRLLERIGFRKEAHYIQSFRMGDEWYDDCVYAILENEWGHYK
jgi:RimJ/RimL family protein N-acetyltransferase